MHTTPGQPGGLLDSLKSFARSILALAQTRLQLLGNEIEEQRVLLMREVMLALAVVFLLGLGIVFIAVFFLVLFWDHRLLVTGIFAVLFLTAAATIYAAFRAVQAERPKAFSATLGELAKDRDSLQ